MVTKVEGLKAENDSLLIDTSAFFWTRRYTSRQFPDRIQQKPDKWQKLTHLEHRSITRDNTMMFKLAIRGKRDQCL